jgi:hypothetical protein
VERISRFVDMSVILDYSNRKRVQADSAACRTY